MALYDATMPIRHGMVTFPGDPTFKMEPFFQRAKGDPFNLALMSMGTHLGTILLHTISTAEPRSTGYPLRRWWDRAWCST